jgi:glycosyltransferase involved in cell wall biosynthesis
MLTESGTADRSNMVTHRSISEAFLEAPMGPTDDFVPLTPFIIHIWRQSGLPSNAALERNEERGKFLYAFYKSFYRTRAPNRLPVPPNTISWLNRPALNVSSAFETHANGLPAQRYYLTRFMLHVWESVRQEMDVRQADGYLRFLVWFALECIPTWNLPSALLPEELLPILNRPVRAGLPMSTAMRIFGELHSTQGIQDVGTAPDDLVVAMSFELMPDILRAGDPRLVPDFISRFWSGRFSPNDPNSLTPYEYLAARAGSPNLAGRDPDTVPALRQWYARQYLTLVPQSDLFMSAPPIGVQDGLDNNDLDSADRLVYVYRDHHTICGLSRAGLQAKEALAGNGLRIFDFDFSFGRERIQEEYAKNARTLHYARSSLHVVNINPEYVPECLACHFSSLHDDCYIIGQFYWELSDTSEIHECGLSLMDELWVASEYLKEVYQRRVAVPVYVMGQAVEAPNVTGRFDRAAFDLPEDAYIFLFTFDAGSVVERKNPLAAVQAFRRAFPARTDNAILVLKTKKANHPQTDQDRNHWRCVLKIADSDDRIRIIDRHVTWEELTGLQAACDCYISLHRSEGFGYGPAEAMALGKPVITTGYSGVTDFCTSETAMLVDYVLERVPQGAYPYMDEARDYYWASPEIEVAARQMRRVYENPQFGKSLGERGQKLILKDYSAEALKSRYRQRLSQLGWL